MKKRYIFSWLVFAMLMVQSIYAQTPPLLQEGFEGTTFPPTGWVTNRVVIVGSSSGNWERVERGAWNPVHSGSFGAALADMRSGNITDLVTPALNIPEAGTYEVSFWIYREYTSKPNEGVKLWVNTTPDTTGGTMLLHVPRNYSVAPDAPNIEGWYRYTADIPISGNVYVIFQGISEWGSQTYIDDISVEVAPTCAKPTNLRVEQVHLNGVDLAWTGEDDVAGYVVEYRQFGTETWLQQSAVDSTFLLTDLVPSSKYEIRVAQVCQAGDTGHRSSSITTTLVQPFPWTETFDSISLWTRAEGLLQNPQSDLQITGYGWSKSSAHVDPDLNKAVVLNIYGSNRKHWLISPPIELTEDAQLTMDVSYADQYDGTGLPDRGSDDRFGIVISTDLGQTWSESNSILYTGGANAPRPLSLLGPNKKRVTLRLTDSTGVPYTGVVMIALYGESTVYNADDYVFVDNFTVEPVGLCLPIEDLLIDSVNSQSVFVRVNHSFTDDFVLEYEIVPVDEEFTGEPTGSRAISVVDGSVIGNFEISDLVAGSTYKFRVRTVCAEGFGTWGTTTTIQVPLPPQALPFFTDFENPEESGFSFNHILGPNHWIIDAPNGGSKMLYITDDPETKDYRYNTGSSGLSYAYVDFMAGTDTLLNISFDWKCSGEHGWSDYDFMKVLLISPNMDLPGSMSGSYSANVINNGGSSLFNDHAEWQHFSAEVPNDISSGSIRRLVFAWRNDGSGGSQPPAAIDNLSIKVASCFVAGIVLDSIVVSNISGNSADVTVAPTSPMPGATTLFRIESSSGGFYVAADAATGMTTLTNLQPSTDYTVKVAFVCASGDTSSFLPEERTFRTTCQGQYSVPYTYGFDTRNPIDDCWSLATGALLPGSAPTNATTNSWSAYFNYDVAGSVMSSGQSGGDWLISPSITLGETPQQIEFYVTRWGSELNSTEPHQGPQFENDVFAVLVSSDNGATWSDANGWIWDANGTYAPIDNLTQTTRKIVLPLDTYSGTIKIAFYVSSSNDSTNKNYILFDDFGIVDKVSCIAPEFRSLPIATDVTAMVTIDPVQADATQWEYEVVPVTETFTGSGVAAFTNPFTAEGLTANTDYKIRVRTVCGENEFSEWSDSVAFYTVMPTQNCPVNITFEEDSIPFAARNLRGGNHWVIDTAVANGGNRSMYITDNDTTRAHYYDVYDPSVALTMMNVNVEAGVSYQLSFDWMAKGEFYDASSVYDYIKVFWQDLSESIPSRNVEYATPSLIFDGNMFLVNEDTWQHESVNLPGSPTDGVKRLVFVWKNDGGSGTQPPAAIDNISLQAVSCFAPSGFAVVPLSTDSVRFSWDNSETDNYEVFIAEFTAETAPVFISAGISDTLFRDVDNLLPGTAYQAYLMVTCEDNTQYISDTITFVTPTTTPFISDFEPESTANDFWQFYTAKGAVAWVIDTAVAQSGTQGLYISGNNGADNNYIIGTEALTYAYVDIQFGEQDEYAISFDWRGYGEDLYDYIAVYLGDPTVLSDDESQLGVPIASNLSEQTNWQHSTVIKSGLANSVKRLLFVWNNDIGWGDQPAGAIDNVSIVANTCPVAAIVVNNISANSAQVASTDPNETTGEWIITLTRGANEVEYVAYALPYTLTDLDASTNYEVHLRKVCGANDTSILSNSVGFQTLCETQPLPYENSFTALPTCWDIMEGRFQEGIATTSLTLYTGSPTSFNAWRAQNLAGRYHMSLDICGSSTSDWLISPVMDLGASGAGVALSFNMWFTHYGTSNPAGGNIDDDKFMVLISTDAGATWSTANATEWNMTNTGAYRMDSIPSIPTRFTIPLDNYSGQIRIAFYGESTVLGGDNELRIDSVLISAGTAPVCEAPTNVTSSGITTTSATIAWTENGSATSWKIDYNGTEVTVSDNPHTLTGLTANTAYTVKVKAVCGTDSESAWSATHTFNTPEETQPVCEAPTNVTSSGITTTSATIAWTENGSATSWKIDYNGTEVTVSDNPHTLTGLTANTAYTVKVKSVCGTDSESAWSVTHTFNTPEETQPVCEAPTNVTSSGITTTSATIAWTENGSATSWKIDYNGTEVTVSDNPHTLTGLTANTAYTVKVKSVCGTDSESAWSATHSFRTGHIESVVTTVEATDVDSTSATLNATVTAGTDQITARGFEWRLTEATVFTPVEVTSSEATFSHTLTGLTPATSYSFRAYIVVDGEKRYGALKDFVTKEVGIDDVTTFAGLRMFPNPATEQVTVEVGNVNGTVKFILTDLNGRVVWTAEKQSEGQNVNTTIDVSRFSEGAYYLRIQNGAKVATQKLIVQ